MIVISDLDDLKNINEKQGSISIEFPEAFLSYARVKDIAKALKTNKSITKIDLSSNDISDADEGPIAIAEALKTNKSITNINLSSNRIGVEGAKAIAEALKTNKSITHIDLVGNDINDEGKKYIEGLLQRNKDFLQNSIQCLTKRGKRGALYTDQVMTLIAHMPTQVGDLVLTTEQVQQVHYYIADTVHITYTEHALPPLIRLEIIKNLSKSDLINYYLASRQQPDQENSHVNKLEQSRNQPSNKGL